MTKIPSKPKNYQYTPKIQKNDLRNLHNVMRNYLPSGSLIAYKANIFVDLICCKGFIAYNGYVKSKFASKTKVLSLLTFQQMCKIF